MNIVRSFTLSFEVKSENIDASYEDGILTLAISRPEEEVNTKIDIK